MRRSIVVSLPPSVSVPAYVCHALTMKYRKYVYPRVETSDQTSFRLPPIMHTNIAKLTKLELKPQPKQV